MIKNVGLAIYALSVVASVITLLVDPVGFDARYFILPLIVILFVSSLGFSYSIASRKSTKAITLVGTALLAILFTMLAFFVIAGIAWLVAISHA